MCTWFGLHHDLSFLREGGPVWVSSEAGVLIVAVSFASEEAISSRESRRIVRDLCDKKN